MKHLNLFTQKELKSLLNSRKGETKFGEHVRLLSNLNNIYDSIKDLDVKYVIFGIEEDYGVLANNGKSGTYKCWSAVKKTLINLQSNVYTHPNEVLILGSLCYTNLIQEKKLASTKSLKMTVELIDKDVSFLVSEIVRAGKIPIAIGGGHNNAYGMIKGTALALNQAISAINIDAHTDFRPEEGRHSGNGFSYAFDEGFLKKYFILGLHENYTSKGILSSIEKLKRVNFCSYEAIEIRSEVKLKTALKLAKDHCNTKFGLEIDCDAIENIPSSAASPSGFSIKQVRRMTHYFGSSKEICYLHICEAIPSKKNATQVGKMISYIITDFMRAYGG